jgi:hypothetical protein
MRDGKFKPGQSGNPSGRPVGSKNKRTLLREELERDGPALASAIKAAALEGADTTAMSLWLARLEPPLRPAAQRVTFDFDPSLPIADQGTSIVAAVARGEIDPDTGKMLLDMLAAHLGLRDVETFLEELKRMRQAKPRNPGGIVET